MSGFGFLAEPQVKMVMRRIVYPVLGQTRGKVWYFNLGRALKAGESLRAGLEDDAAFGALGRGWRQSMRRRVT